MFRRFLKIAKELLPRFDRQERGVALAIFLVVQALLPSYAAALSAANPEDRIIICSAHGLIELDRNTHQPATAQADDGLCVLAQMAGFAVASAPEVGQNSLLAEAIVLPKLGYDIPDVTRLDLFEPQSQRAPPLV